MPPTTSPRIPEKKSGLPEWQRALEVLLLCSRAETWLAENDPEGVAFEYEGLE